MAFRNSFLKSNPFGAAKKFGQQTTDFELPAGGFQPQAQFKALGELGATGMRPGAIPGPQVKTPAIGGNIQAQTEALVPKVGITPQPATTTLQALTQQAPAAVAKPTQGIIQPPAKPGPQILPPPATGAPQAQAVSPTAVSPGGDIPSFDQAVKPDTTTPTGPTGIMDLLQGDQGFDIKNTELYKMVLEQLKQQMGGEGAGVLAQETAAREALKVSQAMRAKQIREGLISSGFRDTGRYIEEGLLAPEEAKFREMMEFERGLIGDKAARDQERITAAISSGMSLMDLLQKGEISKDNFKQQVILQQNEMSWKTGERIGEEQFAAMMDDLNKKHDLLMQENNLTGAKDIEILKSQLELHQLTQEMGHDEKMAYLQNELQNAYADNDVDRQKQILEFQHNQQMNKLDKEQGFEESMKYLDTELQKSIMSEDFEQQKILQKLKFEHEMNMHQDNMKMQEAKLALEQAGVDMAKVQQQYEFIQNEIAQGRADPDAALNYLNEQLKENGITIPPSDPNAWKSALEEDYLMQQYQYALSHGLDPNDPGVGVFDDEGNFIGLQDSHLGAFNSFVNTTIYGTDEGPNAQIVTQLKNGEKDIGYFTGKDINDPVYQELLSDVTTKAWTNDRTTVGNKLSEKRHVFTQMPSVGGFLKFEGVVFQLKDKYTDDKAGTDNKVYTLVNILTGVSFKIDSGSPSEALEAMKNNL